ILIQRIVLTCDTSIMMSSGRSASEIDLENPVKEEPSDTTGTEQGFHCKICSKKFEKSLSLALHMRIHPKEKRFVCTVCDRGYGTKYDLDRHVTMIHRGKWFRKKSINGEHVCEKCQISFNSENDLKAHTVIHIKGKKPFACTICNYKSCSIPALKTHLTMHTDEHLRFCLHCGKEYPYKSQLLIHLMTHTNVKPYSCSECGQKFKQKNNLKTHLLFIHGKNNDSSRGVNENDCTQECKIEKDIETVETSVGESKHIPENVINTVNIKSPQKTINKLFSCLICNYTFTKMSILKNHLLVHASESFKTCTHCSKEFAWKKSLKKHLMTHTNVKGDTLPPNKKDLVDLKIRTDLKYLHACSECKYKSTKKGLLEKHLLKHKSSFECTLCDYKSNTKQDLDIHFSSHTGEMPVSCYLCNFKSAFQRNLDQHYMLDHMDDPTNISLPMKDMNISTSVKLLHNQLNDKEI
ncbi:unnamed protein product, partial [Meganyctiphanes norvegica]